MWMKRYVKTLFWIDANDSTIVVNFCYHNQNDYWTSMKHFLECNRFLNAIKGFRKVQIHGIYQLKKSKIQQDCIATKKNHHNKTHSHIHLLPQKSMRTFTKPEGVQHSSLRAFKFTLNHWSLHLAPASRKYKQKPM